MDATARTLPATPEFEAALLLAYPAPNGATLTRASAETRQAVFDLYCRSAVACCDVTGYNVDTIDRVLGRTAWATFMEASMAARTVIDTPAQGVQRVPVADVRRWLTGQDEYVRPLDLRCKLQALLVSSEVVTYRVWLWGIMTAVAVAASLEVADSTEATDRKRQPCILMRQADSQECGEPHPVLTALLTDVCA